MVMNNYLSEFKRIQSQLPGNNIAWLNAMRQKNLDHFIAHGFPTRKHEEWKYTPTHGIAKQNFTINPQPNKLTTSEMACSIAALLEQNIPLNFHQSNMHSFTALNNAFFSDGVYINIPANTILDKPIIITHTSSTPNQANHIRNLIIVGENSKATIVERYVGENQITYLTNTITEIVCEDNASIEHIKIENESSLAYHMGTIYGQLNKASSMTCHSFNSSGLWVRSDYEIDFQDEHATCTLNGLFRANHKQHIDHHLTINHNKPRCTSYQNYKGIIGDKAKGVFNGKIIIKPGAEQSVAHQTNKNILISSDAEMNTKPQLEIFADDVKCSHGATVGQLDHDALFYLQSRGIEYPEAQQLLLQAFAKELIDKVQFEDIKTNLLDRSSHETI